MKQKVDFFKQRLPIINIQLYYKDELFVIFTVEDVLMALIGFLHRQAFRISRSYFSMVLLDELGLDRERFISPVGSDELFSYIDSFLLDEEEREKLELRSDFCD